MQPTLTQGEAVQGRGWVAVVLRSCQELEGRTGFLFYFSSLQLPISSIVRCVAPELTVGPSLVKDCLKIKHPCF